MFLVLGNRSCPQRQTPYACASLVAINISVYLFQLTDASMFVESAAMIPYEITKGVDLVGYVEISNGETSVQLSYKAAPLHPMFTLFSGMFMHANFMHLFGNVLSLWIFGRQIEHVLGIARFLTFYLIGGMMAWLAHIVHGPLSVIPTLGASGAVAAILGAYLLLFPRDRLLVVIFFFVSVQRASFVLGFWFAFQILGQLSGDNQGIAFAAHIGGFLYGMFAIKYFLDLVPEDERATCCLK